MKHENGLMRMELEKLAGREVAGAFSLPTLVVAAAAAGLALVASAALRQ